MSLLPEFVIKPIRKTLREILTCLKTFVFSFSRLEIISLICTFIITVAAYKVSLHGNFIWDDISIYIVDNELLEFPQGLWKFWFSNEPIDYYPLTYTSFWLEYQWYRHNPFFYRVDNLIIHLITAAVIWKVLKQLNIPGAGLISCLFVLHPVCVESVAWISQRKTLLATGLGFASLSCFLEYEKSARARWLLLSIWMFALSLAAKPVFITLPFIQLFYLMIWQRCSFFRACQKTSGFWMTSFAFGLIGVAFQDKLIGTDVVRDQTFLERLATAGWIVWFYIGKVLWPFPLCFVYPRWDVSSSNLGHWIPLFCLSVILIYGSVSKVLASRVLYASLGFFVITIFPAVGFVDVYFWRYSYVGDHYQYQSMISILAGAVWIMLTFFDRIGIHRKSATLLLAVVLVPMLAWSTHRHARNFVTEATLWGDTRTKNPTSEIALQNYLASVAGSAEAETIVSAAMQLPNLKATALFSRAQIYLQTNQFDKAEDQAQQALEAGFEPHTCHLYLASLAEQRGDLNGAREHLDTVTLLKPHSGIAWYRLGELERRMGNVSAAETAYMNASTRGTSRRAEAFVRLAKLKLDAKNTQDAIHLAQRAVELRPNLLRARVVLEQSLRADGQIEAAERERRILSRVP